MLNLNSFGMRVLNVLNGHASRLVFAGDVLIYVGQQCEREQRFYGPYRYDMQAVTNMQDDRLHVIIGDCVRALRFDRWQAARKDAALALRVVVDIVIAPLADVLSDDQRALLDHARKMLSREVMESLENGYTLRQTAERCGVNRETLRRQVSALRPAA